jgi:hypothetical protein
LVSDSKGGGGHSLKALENWGLRIFTLKRDKIGDPRNLHKEVLGNFYSSPSINRTIKSSIMRGAGIVAFKGEKRNAYRMLMGNPEGKRPLERPRHRREDNNVTDLISVLPGNSFVNTVQHATLDDDVFSVSSVSHPALLTDQ